MVQLPGVVRRRYLTTVNRWDRMDAPVSSLYQATDGDAGQSLLHREVLGPAGIGDIASIVFRDRFGTWAFLDLWRFQTDSPFTGKELATLADDVPMITDALRRCQARSFDQPSPTSERPGPAVLFLTPELEVRGQTPRPMDTSARCCRPSWTGNPYPRGLTTSLRPS
jgi:hypothetical protein